MLKMLKFYTKCVFITFFSVYLCYTKEVKL